SRRVLGEMRIHLEADAAVQAAGLLERRPQAIAGEPDVFDRQRLEQLGAVEPGGDALLDRRVVIVALGDGELKDGGVRGDAHHAVFANGALELTRDQLPAANDVQPDTLAQLAESLGSTGSHVALLPYMCLSARWGRASQHRDALPRSRKMATGCPSIRPPRMPCAAPSGKASSCGPEGPS